MNSIDPKFLIALKKKYNLYQVVAKTCRDMRRIGHEEWTCKCPFHAEDTSSFRVNKTRYHCFGCHAHGDVISWITKTHKVSFIQAVKLLSHSNIPTIKSEEIEKKVLFSEVDFTDSEKMFALNDKVQQFLTESLKTADKFTKDYLNKRFNIGNSNPFSIGYAPNSEALIKRMMSIGYNVKDLIDAGLVLTDSSGSAYSRLRDRLTFPLFNRAGNILGFSGRIIPRPGVNEKLAKYVNPPNTSIFKRRSFLYGWNTCERNDTVIVVEGYADVIGLYQKGIKNVLACMGTAITKEQANYLQTYFKNVLIMLDGDMPGLLGSLEGMKQFDSSVRVAALLLTNNEDPDSLSSKPNTKQILKSMPVITLKDLKSKELVVTNTNKIQYDKSLLNKLAKPFVDDNQKQGWPHFNVVAWVCQAYPQYADEIKSTLKIMLEDTELGEGGKRLLKENNIKSFLSAWKKPSRDIRQKNK